MIIEGIFKSNIGWTHEVLQEMLKLPGIQRVDGNELRADGTYTYAHVFFATEEAASAYLSAMASMGLKVQRLL